MECSLRIDKRPGSTQGPSNSYRNLRMDIGGRYDDETTGLVAHNAVHHSKRYPSSLTLTAVPRKPIP